MQFYSKIYRTFQDVVMFLKTGGSCHTEFCIYKCKKEFQCMTHLGLKIFIETGKFYAIDRTNLSIFSILYTFTHYTQCKVDN